MIRVVVPTDSQEEDTFATALDYARSICAKAGPAVVDVVLLLHSKKQLEHTNLGGFLGKATVKALGAGPVALGGGLRLSLEILTKRPMLTRPSVILAYYADDGLLDIADGLRPVEGVVAVPWIPKSADGWIQRWGPIIHGQASQPAASLISDTVVVGALERLTRTINLSTGLLNASDKKKADETLRILRAKGHADPSNQIQSWAIRNGWKADYAKDLETLSKRVWALTTKPSLSKIENAEERYARWTE